LSDKIALARTHLGKPPAKVSASVSSFVPKAGTPFQWAPMLDREEWRRRQGVIRSSTRVKSVKVKVHAPDCSYLEGVFSRGDRRLGAALETGWRLGARLHGVDADWYGLRERKLDEILPWVCVNDTVSEGFLKRELKRAEKGMVTQTCADADKDPCFICDACERSPLFAKKEEMLAAPLAGSARDEKYAAKNWTFPKSTLAAGAAGGA
jgi:hypothetical protein